MGMSQTSFCKGISVEMMNGAVQNIPKSSVKFKLGHHLCNMGLMIAPFFLHNDMDTHERDPERQDYRNGYYKSNLTRFHLFCPASLYYHFSAIKTVVMNMIKCILFSQQKFIEEKLK